MTVNSPAIGALVMKHLVPLSTQLARSRTEVVLSAAASDPASGLRPAGDACAGKVRQIALLLRLRTRNEQRFGPYTGVGANACAECDRALRQFHRRQHQFFGGHPHAAVLLGNGKAAQALRRHFRRQIGRHLIEVATSSSRGMRLAPEIVAKVNQSLVEVLKMPDVRKQLIDMGYDVAGDSPAAYRAFIRSEIDTRTRIVRDRDIKMD